VTTRIVHVEHEPTRIPVTLAEQCPAGCDLSAQIACWLRRERELRGDLAASGDSPDAEVLRSDLAAAERRIDMLIEFGRWAA
jgi:hypothetical protein